MANKKSIKYGTIFKRSSCLNSTTESKIDSAKRFSILENHLEKSVDKNGQISPSVKSSLRSFIESICNLENASTFYRQPLYIIQELNKVNINAAEEVLNEYVDRVLPYVEDLSNISESIKRYDLKPHQSIKILERVCELNVADRIITNHKKISKRFNIEAEAAKVKTRGLKTVTESLCSLIDTYTIKPYQKLNLCIEEMTYVLDKSGIEYNKADLANYVTEYFLMRSETLNEKELKCYRLALSESYCLEEEDLSKVNYVFAEREPEIEQDQIKKIIQKFMMSEEKTPQCLDHCIDLYDNCSKADIVYNTDKLVWLLWKVYKSDIFVDIDWNDRLPIWLNKITKSILDKAENYVLSKKDVCEIADTIHAVNNLLTVTADDWDYNAQVCSFKAFTEKFISDLHNISHLVYCESNLNILSFVNSENCDTISIREFKLFKFNNMIKAASNSDKYLEEKFNRLYTNNNISRIRFNNENVDIYSYIGEDAKVDICTTQYQINESDIDDTFINFLESSCKEINDKLIIENNTSRAYYIINPGVAEIHIKENTSIELDDTEWNKVYTAENVDLNLYIEQLALIESCCDLVENFDQFVSPRDMLLEFSNNKNLTLEHYEVALEALSLIEDVSLEDVKVFSEQFTNYRYNCINESGNVNDDIIRESNIITSMTKNWLHEENVPFDIQIEAYMILAAVLEGTKPNIDTNPNKKPMDINIKKNNKDEDKDLVNKKPQDINNKDEEKELNNKQKEVKKNPFKGVNINSLKLYLEGLKGKMKNMSQKEKEFCRNLDNTFKRFVKALNDAMVSNRREAIVKGSVIPSFSRCIKICIGLAGLGIVTGGPIVPLLTAIGGFAVSKKLTQKERILLLDEIDTEIEVVDKEIQMAESKNQMKKLRTLLRYKKDLQRQYQRIRYNVRIGKDILPGSNAGFRNKD